MMDNYYFIDYSEICSSGEVHITILEVILCCVIGILLICFLTFILEKWCQEEINEIKARWQSLEIEQTRDQSRL